MLISEFQCTKCVYYTLHLFLQAFLIISDSITLSFPSNPVTM